MTPDWAQLPNAGFGKRRRTPGGANYYRCTLPAEQLVKHDNEIEAAVFHDAYSATSGELLPIDHDGVVLVDWRPDIIVLQRWMRPEMSQAIRAARRTGQVIVNDVDDHFWALHRANRATQSVSEHWNADHYRRALIAGNHVTVSTPELRDVMLDLGVTNDSITVLPNMIDLALWTPHNVRDDANLIGWVGATDYRSGDLETVSQPVRRFTRQHRWTFVHGGAARGTPNARKLLRLTSDTPTIQWPLKPIHRYPTLWNDLDVAIIPLNDIAFNRCKSPIKAMEACAAGVPYVATRIAPYERYGSPLLANGNDEWNAQLESLTDPDVRSRIREIGMDQVSRQDVRYRWMEWSTLYRDLLCRPPTEHPPGVGASHRGSP